MNLLKEDLFEKDSVVRVGDFLYFDDYGPVDKKGFVLQVVNSKGEITEYTGESKEKLIQIKDSLEDVVAFITFYNNKIIY